MNYRNFKNISFKIKKEINESRNYFTKNLLKEQTVPIGKTPEEALFALFFSRTGSKDFLQKIKPDFDAANSKIQQKFSKKTYDKNKDLDTLVKEHFGEVYIEIKPLQEKCLKYIYESVFSDFSKAIEKSLTTQKSELTESKKLIKITVKNFNENKKYLNEVAPAAAAGAVIGTVEIGAAVGIALFAAIAAQATGDKSALDTKSIVDLAADAAAAAWAESLTRALVFGTVLVHMTPNARPRPVVGPITMTPLNPPAPTVDLPIPPEAGETTDRPTPAPTPTAPDVPDEDIFQPFRGQPQPTTVPDVTDTPAPTPPPVPPEEPDWYKDLVKKIKDAVFRYECTPFFLIQSVGLTIGDFIINRISIMAATKVSGTAITASDVAKSASAEEKALEIAKRKKGVESIKKWWDSIRWRNPFKKGGFEAMIRNNVCRTVFWMISVLPIAIPAGYFFKKYINQFEIMHRTGYIFFGGEIWALWNAVYAPGMDKISLVLYGVPSEAAELMEKITDKFLEALFIKPKKGPTELAIERIIKEIEDKYPALKEFNLKESIKSGEIKILAKAEDIANNGIDAYNEGSREQRRIYLIKKINNLKSNHDSLGSALKIILSTGFITDTSKYKTEITVPPTDNWFTRKLKQWAGSSSFMDIGGYFTQVADEIVEARVKTRQQIQDLTQNLKDKTYADPKNKLKKVEWVRRDEGGTPLDFAEDPTAVAAPEEPTKVTGEERETYPLYYEFEEAKKQKRVLKVVPKGKTSPIYRVFNFYGKEEFSVYEKGTENEYMIKVTVPPTPYKFKASEYERYYPPSETKPDATITR